MTQDATDPRRLWDFAESFGYTRRAIALVWETSRPLTLWFAGLTLAAGLLPAAVAWVGKLIIDAVVAASTLPPEAATAARHQALIYIAVEAGIVALLAAAQRGIMVCESLLRVMLAHRVHLLILEKSLSLQLRHFEDAEFYDKLTRARRQASIRPLSLVKRSFGIIQNGISLVSYAVLLIAFSPWVMALLVVAGLPVFVAEARFSNDAFRLFQWRAPETREQNYIETVLAREDYAKEVKLFGLGPLLLERYRGIYRKVFGEDRDLTLRRGFWGFVLGLVATGAFYGAYIWIALATMAGSISLGEMTMYLLLFKQGQSAVAASLRAIGGMYEDNLYLSNLYEFLEHEIPEDLGGLAQGPKPGDGVRFEAVSFTYPGAEHAALDKVSFHLEPGQAIGLVGHNGSGKTTLIKLLTRLYDPNEGRIVLDGLDLREWEPAALRRRVGVIFQDFARYQLQVGENIGAGDVDHIEESLRWESAARKGLAHEFIERLPEGYTTRLGRWFAGGREISGGQWQKVALARAFMRERADIVVLDEPTAAMDADAESQIFAHFREHMQDRMAILISHRFSTVRMADHILVLEEGRLVESGSHEALMQKDGQYARLFELQAAGYR